MKRERLESEVVFSTERKPSIPARILRGIGMGTDAASLALGFDLHNDPEDPDPQYPTPREDRIVGAATLGIVGAAAVGIAGLIALSNSHEAGAERHFERMEQCGRALDQSNPNVHSLEEGIRICAQQEVDAGIANYEESHPDGK